MLNMFNEFSTRNQKFNNKTKETIQRLHTMTAINNSVKLLLIFGIISIASPIQAESVPKDLMGFWSLELESGTPAYMNIFEDDGKPMVHFRHYIGPEGPYPISEIVDGRIKFSVKRKRKKKNNQAQVTTVIEAGLKNEKLNGLITKVDNEGNKLENDPFTGVAVSPMPKSAPNLSKVRFGQPISLFNGKDLTGWKPYEKDKINGWSVEDGMLVNNTTKTDFSPTGAHANLQTINKFEDFWLHIEFLVEANRNSGVYLRGMYEAQVVDRDSRMQGVSGVGSIFSRIPPSENAGRAGGEWQTYDITLVDRHVTVVLNGVKVIDNQPVTGPTGGAIHTNPATAGPIYLQGDHTAVKYKNIYLAPVISN